MKCCKSMALASCALLLASACSVSNNSSSVTASGLDPAKFVAEIDGKPTALYSLVNDRGMEVCITNYGGRIVSVMVPDRNGVMNDVVLGFDSIGAYRPEVNQSDFGASIGRYANRINQGRIVIDGDTVQLPQNNFGHCLHGGPTGWQYKVYSADQPNDSTLVLTIDSPDGDNNFPGNVRASVTYTLTSDNAIDIAYEAVTDRPTVVNMTNHSYFNLNGNPSNPITDNVLMINADSYTPVDSTFMTTGEIAAVEGTPMDFRAPKAVGDEIDTDFIQTVNGRGYDHNWVLNTAGSTDEPAARLMSPLTGIVLEVYTDEPGIQVYTGNFLDGSVTGKGGKTYEKRAAICLETQHYPDSPNKPEWPSVVLRPGEKYTSHCVFRFDVEK
ncbi:MAG: galactose mutarotase [Muribaculaceae bacterium]|nr:galactose mutarotase [Muribaculaceae bacterium]